jgi:methyl-accepting chemotaxis protein
MFFLIGSIALYSYISYGYNKIASKNTQKHLKTISDSIFQTVRTSMGFGDATIVAKTLKDAKSINGIKDVEIFKSQEVIDFFALKERLTTNMNVRDNIAYGIKVNPKFAKGLPEFSDFPLTSPDNYIPRKEESLAAV